MPGFIVASGNPQFREILTMYCAYYGYCHILGFTGNPLFHIIYCALFIGAPAYCHNATIHYALFIMQVFIGATANPQFIIIYAIYSIYYGYYDLLGCTGNSLFHAIYCAHFGRMSVYSEKPTIYYALFIMQ